MVTGLPKSGKARVIDLDPQTLAALRAHRKARGMLSLALAREEALLADIDGHGRHPERFSRTFRYGLATARKNSARMRCRRSGCTILVVRFVISSGVTRRAIRLVRGGLGV
jgi:hypothetical protein